MTRKEILIATVIIIALLGAIVLAVQSS